MKRFLFAIYTALVTFGFDPRKTYRSLKGLLPYLRDYSRIREQQGKAEARVFPFATPYPVLSDRYADSGNASGHYFHQDFLVARRIFANAPEKHVDVGSRIDGFVTHLAVFRPVEVLDIRPLTNTLHNITFTQADLMKPIPEGMKNYCDSLSCLHAIEHFGLGRYGDPVDFNGYLAGLENLHAILKPGGTFYLSFPIGPQRIEFNAHRVFSVGWALEYFKGKYTVEQFSYVDDKGDLHEDVPLTEAETARNFGCHFGCGIFELTKR